MPVTFVANLSLSNNLITNICFIILTVSLTLAPSVEGHSKSCQHCKIMRGYIVGKGHLLVKHVEKVSDKEFHILFTGDFHENLIAGKPHSYIKAKFDI